MSHAYERLSPECVLDAIESVGLQADGHVLTLNSYENRVFQIGVDEHSDMVAKFYRPGRWSNASIIEEHTFSIELAEQEIPIIPPWQHKAKTLFEFEGFRFSLFEKRGGRAPELEDLDNLEWIGRFIGRIHLHGRTKPFAHRPQLNSQQFGWLARETVVNSSLLPAEYRELYASVSAELIEKTEALFSSVKAKDLRLHGDCHPGNILWTDKGPHFVDMDDCRTGPAVQDLWMLLSGDRQEMTIQLDALLEGYQVFCEFDQKELALIEPLRSLRLLHYTAWITRRWDDPAFPLAFPWFAEAAYWPGHINDLQQQLLRTNEPPLSLYP